MKKAITSALILVVLLVPAYSFGVEDPPDTPEPSLLSAVATLASAGIYSFGTADTPTLNVFWTPPTEGTAVHHYEGVVESWPSAGGDTIRMFWETPDDTPETSFTYAYGHATRANVRAVDAKERSSEYTPWSVIWLDDGPPGMPSVPRFGLVMSDN